MIKEKKEKKSNTHWATDRNRQRQQLQLYNVAIYTPDKMAMWREREKMWQDSFGWFVIVGALFFPFALFYFIGWLIRGRVVIKLFWLLICDGLCVSRPPIMVDL